MAQNDYGLLHLEHTTRAHKLEPGATTDVPSVVFCGKGDSQNDRRASGSNGSASGPSSGAYVVHPLCL
jgi:hypothetical protein